MALTDSQAALEAHVIGILLTLMRDRAMTLINTPGSAPDGDLSDANPAAFAAAQSVLTDPSLGTYVTNFRDLVKKIVTTADGGANYDGTGESCPAQQTLATIQRNLF